jgi:hypothetical protein
VAAFIVIGFAIQVLLVAFFIGQLRPTSWRATIGNLVYGAGIVTAALAAILASTGAPWHLIVAPALYTAWSALGAAVDLLRPIPWRNPPRWTVLIPYAALLMGSLLAFWIPLWWIDVRLWLAFGVLYAIHTTINLATHRSRGVDDSAGPATHGPSPAQGREP